MCCKVESNHRIILNVGTESNRTWKKKRERWKCHSINAWNGIEPCPEKLWKKLLLEYCLKCERLSTGKTRAESSCRYVDEILLVSRMGETPSLLINVVFASWLYRRKKRIVLKIRRHYECRLFNGCKVIVVQLITNVVPKVSPKHYIVILWYILYNRVNC